MSRYFEGRLRVAGVVLLAVAGLARGAAAAAEKVIPYDGPGDKDLRGLIQKFDQVLPPPPPVESVLIGTLDVATGTFTWGPTINRIENDRRPDLLNPALSRMFDASRIRPTQFNLDPQILGMQSIGLNVPVFQSNMGVVGSGATSGGGPTGATGNAATNEPAGTTGDSRKRPAPGRTAAPPVRVPRKATVEARPGAAAEVTRLPGAAVDLPVRGPGVLTGGSGLMWEFHAPVRSGRVDMVFKVINQPAGTEPSLQIEGRTATGQGGTVDLIVPPRTAVQFKLTCGGKEFADALHFDRPPVLGYFMLEAFPVAIVYEPPGSGSSQTYSTIKQVGTTLESFTRDGNAASEKVNTQFSTVTEMIGMVDTIGEGVAKAYPAVGAAIKAGGQVLEAAWGTSETSEEVTHTVTEKRSLSIKVTNAESVYTTAHLGPGKGDVIQYLVKPVFAWLAAQDPATGKVYITVSLLGYKRVATYAAETLRSGQVTEPNAEMIKLLLAHDPLTAESRDAGGGFKLGKGLPGLKVGGGGGGADDSGFGANPAPGRFVPAHPFEREFGGSGNLLSFERTIESSDVTETSTTHTLTTKETAGFLSYVATNVPQDGDTSVSTTTGSSVGTSVSDTVKVEVKYESAVNEPILLRAFYDRKYGTFAFQQAPMGQGVVSGAMTSAEGEPAGNQDVLLQTAEGIVIATRTDKNGRYTFHTDLLKSGKHALVIGGQKIPIDFKGSPIKDIKITLPGGVAVSRGGADAPAARDPKPAERAPAGAGRTLPGGAGTPGGGAAIITPNPELKGRLGRVLVNFPANAEGNVDVEVTVYPAGDEKKYIKWGKGDFATEILPGRYDLEVNKKRVPGVEVRARHDTRLPVGVLRVHAGKDTEWSVFEPGAKEYLFWKKGDHDVGLPVGPFEIEILGQREKVTIEPGKLTEF